MAKFASTTVGRWRSVVDFHPRPLVIARNDTPDVEKAPDTGESVGESLPMATAYLQHDFTTDAGIEKGSITIPATA